MAKAFVDVAFETRVVVDTYDIEGHTALYVDARYHLHLQAMYGASRRPGKRLGPNASSGSPRMR